MAPGKAFKCSKCGKSGHNRSNCPQPLQQATPRTHPSAMTQEYHETHEAQEHGALQVSSDSPSDSSQLLQSSDGEQDPALTNSNQFSNASEGSEDSTTTNSNGASKSDEGSQDSDDLDEITRHLRLCAGPNDDDNDEQAAALNNTARIRQHHALKTTPIFSSKVKAHTAAAGEDREHPLFNKYGLFGRRIQTYDSSGAKFPLSKSDNLIYSNTSAPWSAFICGQQGAGKSYTLSCLLENALTEGTYLGKNDKALAGLVFHYDKNASDTAVQVCEAAYLCSKGVSVQILVMPSNFRAMKDAYYLPDIPKAQQPVVKPLLLGSSSLKVDHMLTLMGMNSTQMPLYMASIMQVVRDMKTNDETFTMRTFEAKLKELNLSTDQNQPLALRMQLLKALLYSEASDVMRSRCGGRHTNFDAAGLTIIDLSCSTMSESNVCSMYEICLSMFLASRNSDKKVPQSLVVAIDEAHKFLTGTSEAMSFTEELVRLIRQQRHLSSRVIIATQEPTLSTQLLDLCDLSVVHRFRSPAWFDAIRNHLGGMIWTGSSESRSGKDMFETIVGLGDGEALLFCPNAYLDAPDLDLKKPVTDIDHGSDGSETSESSEQEDGAESVPSELAGQTSTLPGRAQAFERLRPLNTAYIKLQIRKRLTDDGGKSQMAQ